MLGPGSCPGVSPLLFGGHPDTRYSKLPPYMANARSGPLAQGAPEVVGHEKQVFAVVREQPGGHEKRVKTQGG